MAQSELIDAFGSILGSHLILGSIDALQTRGIGGNFGEKCNIPKFCDCDCDCDVIVIYCICFALQLVLALSALDLHLGSILFDLQDLAAGTFAGKLLNISIV